MNCPRCNLEIAGRGLAAHQKGARCEVEASIRENREAGLAPVQRSCKPWLDEVGIPYTEAPVRFIAGFKGRATKIIYAAWTAPEIAETVEMRYGGMPTFVGPVKLPIAFVKARLRVIARRHS